MKIKSPFLVENDTSVLRGVPSSANKVFMSDGSGGASWQDIVIPAPIIDVTYAELIALIGSQGLVAGQQYRITDFATKHYIVDGDGTQYTTGDGIVTGVTEPLICLAIGVDEIHAEVKSEMYPQDIIYYDWDANNWLNDLSFGYDDGGGVAIISGWKGVIISRHDTLKEIKAPSDWRNCLTRRWETAATAWDDETTYAVGDIVSHAATSMVYKSLTAANLNNEPTGTSDNYWVVMLDLTKYIYWNASPTSWNGITSGVGHDDFLLFNSLADVFNVNIDTTVSFPAEGFISLLPRSTFFNSALNLNIGAYFCTNTIGESFNSNTIGTGFYSNTIGAYFNSNTIGTDFYGNTIGASFNSNTIGAYFNSNTIGTDFYGNTIGASFSRSTIGASFKRNMIGASFKRNMIGVEFQNNTIGAGFSDNTIGVEFQYNTIGAGFSDNTIGAGFQMNEVADNSIASVDFTTATHVYVGYNCYLYKRPDGTAKLRYYNNSDVQQIVLPTA